MISYLNNIGQSFTISLWMANLYSIPFSEGEGGVFPWGCPVKEVKNEGIAHDILVSKVISEEVFNLFSHGPQPRDISSRISA